jgi:hypothetical protein
MENRSRGRGRHCPQRPMLSQPQLQACTSQLRAPRPPIPQTQFQACTSQLRASRPPIRGHLSVDTSLTHNQKTKVKTPLKLHDIYFYLY